MQVNDAHLSQRVEWTSFDPPTLGSSCWFQSMLPSCFLPSDYREENRRTIGYFTSFLEGKVGVDRMNAICDRVKIDLASLAKSGAPLTSRDVTKLIHSAHIVTMEDLQNALTDIHNNAPWTFHLDADLRQQLNRVLFAKDLAGETFHQFYEVMSKPFEGVFEVGPKEEGFWETVASLIYALFIRFFYEPYDRLQRFAAELERNSHYHIDEFFEKLALGAYMFEDVPVGTIYPAPKDAQGNPRDYGVAAKLFTANGQLSFFLVPITQESGLPPLRITRGTSFSFSGLDALSHFITDFQKNIGEQGYESGIPYDEEIRKLGVDQWTLIGYSIGGCISYWIAAHSTSEVKEVWTYRAPGVPSHVLNRLYENISREERTLPFYIYEEAGDFVHNLGDHRPGYQAPSNVTTRLSVTHQKSFLAHMAPGLFASRISGMEGGFSEEEVQERLSNRNWVWLENIRKFLGGEILAPLLMLIRDIVRALFGSRVEELKGLWIEEFTQDGHYGVKRVIHEPRPSVLPDSFATPIFA